MTERDRLRGFAGGAAILLGLGVGLWVLSAVSERGRESEPEPPAPNVSAERREIRLPSPPATEPLPSDPRPPDANLNILRGELDAYEKALEVLGSKDGEPLARRFAAEFLREPSLKEAWKSFGKHRDRNAFLGALKGSAAFSGMMHRYAGDPAFRPLAEDVARRLALGAWLRQQSRP